MRSRLNCQRDSAAGFLIEDEVSTGFCGSKFLNPRLRVAASAKVPDSSKKANLEIPVFDVKLFLDSAGLGRKVARFRAKETVFTQGDPAKQVMYIQDGGAKLTVVNESRQRSGCGNPWTGRFSWGRVPCRPVQLPGDRDHNSTYQRAGH